MSDSAHLLDQLQRLQSALKLDVWVLEILVDLFGRYVRNSELKEALYSAWEQEELGVVVVEIKKSTLAGEQKFSVGWPFLEMIGLKDVFALVKFIVSVKDDQIFDLVVVNSYHLGGVLE